ncbi:MAG: hypothetical protein ACRDEA_19320 [Microcystaceae cyanobacterium]
MASGANNREIAQSLFLSENTSCINLYLNPQFGHTAYSPEDTITLSGRYSPQLEQMLNMTSRSTLKNVK